MMSSQTQTDIPAPTCTPMYTQTQSQTAASAATQESYDANADIKSRAELLVNVLYIDYIQLWLRKPADFVAAPTDGPLPVIRIFGATDAGQHAVVHVHGFLPYLYFRPASSEDTSFNDEKRVKSYLPAFQRALEKRLQEHRVAQMDASKQNTSDPGARFVDRMEVVERTSIYGLQGPQWFVRVFLRKPTSTKQCRIILEAGSMLGEGGIPMATWEAHVPFILQFTSDLNIKPTGWLYLSANFRLRSPLPTLQEAMKSCGPSLQQENALEIRDGLIFQGAEVPSNMLWDADSEKSINEAIDDFPMSQIFTQSVEQVRVPTAQPSMHQQKLPDTPRYVPPRNGTRAHPREDLVWKDSTCVLELDVPCYAILNAHLLVPSFGAELWEVESRRRRRVGMSADHVPEAPPKAVSCCQSQVFIEEKEYNNRFDRLRKKGRELRRLQGHISGSTSPSPSGVISPESKSQPNDIVKAFLTSSAEALVDIPIDREGTEDFVKADMERLSGSQRDEASAEQILNHDTHLQIAARRQFNNDGEESEGEADQSVEQELAAITASTQMPDELSPLRETKAMQAPSTTEQVELFETQLPESSEKQEHILQKRDDISSTSNAEKEMAVKSLQKKLRKRPISSAFRHKPQSLEASPLPKQSVVEGSSQKKRQISVCFSPSPDISSTQSGESVADAPTLVVHSVDPRRSKYILLKPKDITPCVNTLVEIKTSGSLKSSNQKPFFSNNKDEPMGAQAFSSDFFKREHAARASYRTNIRAFDGGKSKRRCAMKDLLNTSAKVQWPCSKCTFMNESTCATCSMCNFGRVVCERISAKRQRLLVPSFAPPAFAALLPTSTPRKGRVTQLSSPEASTACSIGLLPAPLLPCEDTALTEPCARFTLTSLEIHMKSRPPLLSDPENEHDAIELVVYATDDVRAGDEHESRTRTFGILAVISGIVPVAKAFIASAGLPSNTVVDIVPNEKELLRRLGYRLSFIDPDVLCGYEIQRSSLGLLLARAEHVGIPLRQSISRMIYETPSQQAEHDEGYTADHESGIFVTGRLVLNIWRRMRAELKLNNYSIGNVSWHLLKTTIPQFSPAQLQRWYDDPKQRFRTIRHIFRLADLDLRMLEEMDLVRRTCESARLYGIDFFSVLTRGSQYRVEAALIARAHARGFLLLSPQSVTVTRQASLEHIALVLEPTSSFYSDPVVVLDFQSLYPSMCIAHNLCYSTIFAKLLPGTGESDETTGRLGVIKYPEAQSSLAAAMHGETNSEPYVSPSGSVFASPEIRVGVLPEMLKEILSTRRMIQRAMSTCKAGAKNANKVLYRVLDARQLAIKLLANVTYGYTAAAFSGRMPMSELADSIVSSGRASLQGAMSLVRHNTQWGHLEIVYGDTDSMFVHLHGRSKQEAFSIGRDIAATITAHAPVNVALKFEKVYHPCVLVAKKRYTGLMYETETQDAGSLDVKGLECVRRDQCPATQKLQEKVLRTLFATRDLSLVREYVCSQFSRLLLGAQGASVRDFVFSKEVRLGHYRNENQEPPGAVLARTKMAADQRQTPPYAWRVPYVVCSKAPGTLLKHLVECPLTVLASQRSENPLHINGRYYVEKCVLPALERVLVLCGGDIRQWYSNMTRPRTRRRLILYPGHINRGREHFTDKNMLQKTMDVYVNTPRCLICGNDAVPSKNLCGVCLGHSEDDEARKGVQLGRTVATLSRKLNHGLKEEAELAGTCRACTLQAQEATLFSRGEPLGLECCSNMDCKVFLSRCRRVLSVEDTRTALTEANLEVKELEW